MTTDQALKIRNFAITWCEKVVSKRKDYLKRLTDAIEDLIPLNIDKYDNHCILDCADWDEGEEYIDGYGHHCSWPGLDDTIRELIEEDNIFNLSKKGQNDIVCALRIAVVLFIKQSGGVVGYTYGDLKKAFDGNIPDSIVAEFGFPAEIKDDEPVWL